MLLKEKDSFKVLYDEMSVPVFTVAYRITKNREDAEDVMQEVFIKLFTFPVEERIKNIRAWLFRITHNLAIDKLRKSRKQQLNPNIEDLGMVLESDLDTKFDLEKAIFQLPDCEREIITLHINVGMKFYEIANILGMPLGTILWKYYKAIKRLRETLQKEDIEV